MTHAFISCLALSARRKKKIRKWRRKQSEQRIPGKYLVVCVCVFYPSFSPIPICLQQTVVSGDPISMRNRSISRVDLFRNWTWRGKNWKHSANVGGLVETKTGKTKQNRRPSLKNLKTGRDPSLVSLLLVAIRYSIFKAHTHTHTHDKIPTREVGRYNLEGGVSFSGKVILYSGIGVWDGYRSTTNV